MFLFFRDIVIDFGLTRYQRQGFSNGENAIKNFSQGREDINLRTLGFYNINSISSFSF